MADKPITALYVGYTTGTENHGDEALMWIIRDLLAPEIKVITEGQDYDVALLGGGTLINQSPWLIEEFASKLDHAGRGIVFGTGVGDLYFWGNHFDRWVSLLDRCELVGVRGPTSAELLRQHGFDRAEDIGDPYLWLKPPVLRTPVHRHLGVNIGSTNNSLWGTTDHGLCDSVAEALKELERRGWSFSFVSVWEDDLPLLERLREKLACAERYPLLNARTQTLEVYSALAACQLFLGEKLHANAMAAVAGTPFLALEYQPKVREFAASLGMEDYVLSTADISPELLVEKVEAMAARHAEIRRQLSAACDVRRTSIIRFAEKVKTTLTAKAADRR